MVNGTDFNAFNRNHQLIVNGIINRTDVKSIDSQILEAINNELNRMTLDKKKTSLKDNKAKKIIMPKKQNECQENPDIGPLEKEGTVQQDDCMMHNECNEPMCEDSPLEYCPHCGQYVDCDGVVCDSCDYWLHYQCEGISDDFLEKQKVDMHIFLSVNGR